MILKNEKGFSVIEIGIAVVVVAVIISVGVLIVHRDSHAKLSVTNTSKTTGQTSLTTSSSPNISTGDSATPTSSSGTPTTSTSAPATKTTTAPTASPAPAVKPSSNSIQASTIISQFNSAVASGDQTTVKSLESPLFIESMEDQEQGEKLATTDNYYVFCQETGYSCTNTFTASHLSTAQETSSTAANPNGVTDTVESFTETYTTNNSTVTLTFDVYATPNGSSWLIDRVDLTSN